MPPLLTFPCLSVCRSGGSFLSAAYIASECCSYGCLNNHKDLFQGSQNLMEAWNGKVSLKGGDTLCEGGCLPCVKLWVGSDRSFPMSHAVIVKGDE